MKFFLCTFDENVAFLMDFIPLTSKINGFTSNRVFLPVDMIFKGKTCRKNWSKPFQKICITK